MSRNITTCVAIGAAAFAPLVAQAQTTAKADAAGGRGAPTLLDSPARLLVRDAMLPAALALLSETSGVPVAYSSNMLARDAARVSCSCRDVSVGEALKTLLGSTDYQFAELVGQVVVFASPRVAPRADALRRLYDVLRPEPAAPMMLATYGSRSVRAIVQPTARQGRPVAGTVVDGRSQRPLAGAQLVVEGTDRGALTDAVGRFRIDDVSGTEVTLVATMIGYRTARQTVRPGDTAIQLALSESAIELDEVVVTGTPGGTERRALGTVVGKVDAGELMEVAPITNVGQLLNARVPGVTMMGGIGVLGEGPRVRIRGRTSISLKSDPIIYVDGIRVTNETGTGPAFQGAQSTSRLMDFDPNQIESIEVIKGPAAATLYGTEASNGVIQIITKRGTPSERPVLTATIRQGANWFMNPEGRVQQNYNRDPATGELLGPFNIFESERAAGREIFETGRLASYGLSASGGTEGLQYYISADYTDNHGIEPNNAVSRFAGRTNLDLRPNSSIHVSTSLGFTRQRIDLPFSNAVTCTICQVVRAQPLLRNTNQLGFFFAATPYILREAISMWQELDRYTAGVQLSQRTAWFSHRLAVGTDQTSQGDNFLATVPRPEVAPLLPLAQWRTGQKIADRRLIRVNTVDYGATATANVIDGWQSQTSVGAQYFGTSTHFTRSEGQNFPAPGLNAVTAAANTLAGEDFVENVTVGAYLQQQLSFRDRIYLTGAIRGDDNSAFGDDFDFVVYPKISASWVISEEPFWNVGLIDQLRLRAAYGQSGQQPQSFAALQTYSATTARGGASGLTPESIGNPELGPERGEEIEAGFEAALFGGRFGIEFTYYDKRTEDAILLRQNAPSSGFPGTQFVNGGLITNKGIELGLNGDVLDTERLRWSLGLHLSTNENKVVDLDPDDPSLTFIPTIFENRIVEGFPISGHFKQKVVSATYNPTTGRMENILCDGGTGLRGLEPGGAPVDCSVAPRVYLGPAEPRWEGAFTSDLTFANRLQLKAQLDFRGGNRLFYFDRWITCTTYLICEESPGIRPEAVDPIAAAEAQIGAPNIAVSHYASKADFVKLREVSVSYILPDGMASAFGARRARIAVTGRNLHTWTDYIGLDPESFRPHLLEEEGGYSYRDQGTIPSLASLQVVVTVTW